MTTIDYRSHLHKMKEEGICPFCLEKKYAVDENDSAFVLPARAPYREDHILICPKKHGETIEDFTQWELQDLYALITKREKILYKKHGELVVFLRQGSVWWSTGKTISHLHRHIVPHFEIKFWGTQEASDARMVYSDDIYNRVQEEMKTYLNS